MRRLFSFVKSRSSANGSPASRGKPGPGFIPLYPTPTELTELMQGGMYEFDAMIGVGGMAAVYRGMQTRLRRPVAIKVLHRDFGAEHDYARRFQREAQILAQMSHPNIVSVYDTGFLGEDYLYFVMEFIEGSDLHHLLTLGPVALPRAAEIFTAVCDALAYAHGQGLVHRDIKPANILLAKDGRVKVADFGLAKSLTKTTGLLIMTQAAMGTPEYAAPEQYDHSVRIDGRADLYALAVVLYQMLTGVVPRGAWEPPSALAATPPRLDQVLIKALSPNPAQRHSSAQELRAEFLRALAPGTGRTAVADDTGPRVLVLEDDALLRQLIVRTLRDRAFQVCETADGADTVRRYEEAMREGHPFDVVLVDLTIPNGMGGARAMELLRALDPQARGVVSSGNPADPAMLFPDRHGFAAALPKPYDPRDLLRVVTQAAKVPREAV